MGSAFTADGDTDAPAGVDSPASSRLRSQPNHRAYYYTMRRSFSMGCNPTGSYWTYRPDLDAADGGNRRAEQAGRSPKDAASNLCGNRSRGLSNYARPSWVAFIQLFHRGLHAAERNRKSPRVFLAREGGAGLRGGLKAALTRTI